MRRPAAILAAFACLGAHGAAAQTGPEPPFLVFFDWGKPELTRDAEAALQEAVAAFRRTRPDRIQIEGHTDRSGPAAVNLAASRRRAEAVRARLISLGIPATAIVLSAAGESRPIVATEDGVREAQNRRVEIRFQPR